MFGGVDVWVCVCVGVVLVCALCVCVELNVGLCVGGCVDVMSVCMCVCVGGSSGVYCPPPPTPKSLFISYK